MLGSFSKFFVIKFGFLRPSRTVKDGVIYSVCFLLVYWWLLYLLFFMILSNVSERSLFSMTLFLDKTTELSLVISENTTKYEFCPFGLGRRNDSLVYH